MIKVAEVFIQKGADGLVIGGLTSDAGIDFQFMSRFTQSVRAVRPSIQITFHKAVDTILYGDSPDFGSVVASLASFCDRVLTSGGHDTAINGAKNIRAACESQRAPIIIAAGGIRVHNVARVIQQTGVLEVHSRCPNIVPIVRGLGL